MARQVAVRRRRSIDKSVPSPLDLLQWLMGPVAEVTGRWANLNHPYIEVEDTVVAILRFRSGGLASITVSVSQKPGLYTKIHIHGSNGASIGAQTDSGATFIAGLSEVAEPPLNDIWTIPNEERQLEVYRDQDRIAFSRTADPTAISQASGSRIFARSAGWARSRLSPVKKAERWWQLLRLSINPVGTRRLFDSAKRSSHQAAAR